MHGAGGAWATWDGRQARGGALPAGSDNYMAELWAIERTLACAVSGQRVLIMCDCTGAIEAVEDAWRRAHGGRRKSKTTAAVRRAVSAQRRREAGDEEGTREAGGGGMGEHGA